LQGETHITEVQYSGDFATGGVGAVSRRHCEEQSDEAIQFSFAAVD
jgi:hypothetical protein